MRGAKGRAVHERDVALFDAIAGALAASGVERALYAAGSQRAGERVEQRDITFVHGAPLRAVHERVLPRDAQSVRLTGGFFPAGGRGMSN